MAHHLLPVYLLQVLDDTSITWLMSPCIVSWQEHDLYIAQLYLMMRTTVVDQEKNIPAIDLYFSVD